MNITVIWNFIKKVGSFIVRLCVHKVLKIIFLQNTHFFYSRYLNSDFSPVIFIKNFISPNRLLIKIKYGFVRLLPKFLLSGEESPCDKIHDDKVDDCLKKLKKNGIVFFDSAHPDLAEYFLKKHNHFLNSIEPADKYENLMLDIYDDQLSSLISNPLYLSIMSLYYNNRQPFLRGAPALKITSPISKRLPTKKALNNKSKFNCDWHFDTVNMLQIHFFLDDVTEKDTHMLLALNSHSCHRVSINRQDNCYSDEYIFSNYKVIPIIGKKGTVVIWDSNAVHCANPIPKTTRSLIQALYTPGNDILTETYGSDYGIKVDRKALNKLTPISKNIFKFIALDRKKSSKNLGRAKTQSVYFQSNKD